MRYNNIIVINIIIEHDHRRVYLRTTTLRTVAALASLVLRWRTTRQLPTKRCRCRRSLPAKVTRRSSARR